MSASRINPQTSSRLFDLPAELRNKIYVFAFTHTQRTPHPNPIEEPSTTTFVLDNYAPSFNWLASLSPTLVALLQDVRVHTTPWREVTKVGRSPKRRDIGRELFTCLYAAAKLREISLAVPGLDRKILHAGIMNSWWEYEWTQDPEGKYETLVQEADMPEETKVKLRKWLCYALENPVTWEDDLKEEFSRRGLKI